MESTTKADSWTTCASTSTMEANAMGGSYSGVLACCCCCCCCWCWCWCWCGCCCCCCCCCCCGCCCSCCCCCCCCCFGCCHCFLLSKTVKATELVHFSQNIAWMEHLLSDGSWTWILDHVSGNIINLLIQILNVRVISYQAIKICLYHHGLETHSVFLQS